MVLFHSQTRCHMIKWTQGECLLISSLPAKVLKLGPGACWIWKKRRLVHQIGKICCSLKDVERHFKWIEKDIRNEQGKGVTFLLVLLPFNKLMNICKKMWMKTCFQHALLKPSLVNMISKDMNLAFYLSVYKLVYSSNLQLWRNYQFSCRFSFFEVIQ